MSSEYYYQLCYQAIGEVVEIETADGAKEQALIEKVDRNYLYLRTLEDLTRFFKQKNEDVDQEDWQKSLIAVPLASILSLNFIPLMYY